MKKKGQLLAGKVASQILFYSAAPRQSLQRTRQRVSPASPLKNVPPAIKSPYANKTFWMEQKNFK